MIRQSFIGSIWGFLSYNTRGGLSVNYPFG